MVCTFNNYNALVGEDSQETNINVNQIVSTSIFHTSLWTFNIKKIVSGPIYTLSSYSIDTIFSFPFLVPLLIKKAVCTKQFVNVSVQHTYNTVIRIYW